MDGKLILEVSQLNQYIKETLDADELLTSVVVRGELSNFKRYPSGHVYFTLKDRNSNLKCVMFRSNAMRLRFKPENGMSVLCSGRVAVYERDGVYQLYTLSMMPDGAGDLSVAFEQLKKKLGAEGLFDEVHKLVLPEYPEKIAVLTSPAGAAVHDILRILRVRYPLARVMIVPVRVQGDAAAGEISRALDYVSNHSLADLIILGRGGGSLEDLWAFNEEQLARAVYRCRIPVISAVGHEPDVTISDYVADRRASTPSNAAEIAVPDVCELLEAVENCQNRLKNAILTRLNECKNRLERYRESRPLQSAGYFVEGQSERLDSLTERLSRAMSVILEQEHARLEHQNDRLSGISKLKLRQGVAELSTMAAKLDALSPLKVLSRGYSIVTDERNKVITDAATLETGGQIHIRFRCGSADATVTNRQEG